ncbi:MAG: BRCT domain-containing protein, partial [Planctomycetota bacterium]
MSLDDQPIGAKAPQDGPLHGERLVLVGRFSGRSRPEAIELIRSGGGEVVDSNDESATLVVLG